MDSLTPCCIDGVGVDLTSSSSVTLELLTDLHGCGSAVPAATVIGFTRAVLRSVSKKATDDHMDDEVCISLSLIAML